MVWAKSLPVSGGDGQEGGGEHGEGDPPVPRGPGADLALVQVGQALGDLQPGEGRLPRAGSLILVADQIIELPVLAQPGEQRQYGQIGLGEGSIRDELPHHRHSFFVFAQEQVTCHLECQGQAADVPL